MSHAGRPIAIAVGDPAGVGPDVSMRAAAALRGVTPCVLFGDSAQLRACAESIGLPGTATRVVEEGALAALPPGVLGLVDTGRVAAALIAQHAAHPECGRAQLRALECAARAVREGRARALVTGPTSKAAIVTAGVPFMGQTEFLAALDGRCADDVTMMFLGPKLRVALVTTHLAVAEVPAAITTARVERTLSHLLQALARLIPARALRIQVTGLNPHAGEQGLFGREEERVIEPAVARVRTRYTGTSLAIRIDGPLPAESVFRASQRGEADGVVAMFHDQATIASKLLDWGAAVNTTWGLSFVRTSVDHGVAYDAARAGTADAAGMQAALAMALRLTGTPEPEATPHGA